MKVIITIPQDSLNINCTFTNDNDNVLFWDKMSKGMRSDIVNALGTFTKLFGEHINDTNDGF